MDSVDDVRLRTSRGPLLAFVVLVVAGIATGAWALFFREATRPTAVLVGVSGCSEACVDNLGRRLRFHLEGHGLEVLPGEEDGSADARLASVRSLDELTSLATELGAAHALLITVEPLAQRPGILGEGSVALVARVRGRTLTRGEDTREPHDLVFAVETTSEDRARMQAGRRGVDALADALAAEILGSGPVEAWRAGAPSAHEYERYEDVGEAVRGLEARARGKAEFEAACEASAEALAAEGPLGATCLTRGCGEEYLVGVAPDGQWAVVREETGAPVFPIGSAADVRRAETPERLVRVPLDGSPRQTLVATDNLYSYATLSEDGRALAYVELADRVAVLVWQDVETGERRILRAVEAPERLLFPHVSPDGEWVSYAYRPFRRGEAQTFVAPADGGPGYEPVRFGSNGRWVRLRPPPREDAAGAAEGDAETASEPEPEVLLAVVVPGIAEAPAEEGASDAQGTSDAQGESDAQGTSDAQGASDTEDAADAEDTADAEGTDDAEGTADAEEGEWVDELLGGERAADAALPPMTHVALARLGPRGAEIVARIGGRERPVSAVIGATEDGRALLLASSSRAQGCGLVRWEPATGAQRFVRTTPCVFYPTLGPDGAVYADAAASAEGDLAQGDGEIVRVDPRTGEVTALTVNAIRDRYPSARPVEGRTRLVFERIPRRRYARHPVASVCWADVDAWAPTPLEDGDEDPEGAAGEQSDAIDAAEGGTGGGE